MYSKHIKWVPIGNQKKKFKDVDVGSIHPDILIAKMRPGHELDLKLFAVKSNGKDHAKFCPVGMLLPIFVVYVLIYLCNSQLQLSTAYCQK